MKTCIYATAVAVLAIAISACSVLTPSELRLRVAVAEYVDGDVERAERVIEWAQDSQAALEHREYVNWSDLRAAADKRIPWDELKPYQRVRAMDVLANVEAELAQRVEDGKLPAHAIVELTDILRSIERAAHDELRYLR